MMEIENLLFDSDETMAAEFYRAKLDQTLKRLDEVTEKNLLCEEDVLKLQEEVVKLKKANFETNREMQKMKKEFQDLKDCLDKYRNSSSVVQFQSPTSQHEELDGTAERETEVGAAIPTPGKPSNTSMSESENTPSSPLVVERFSKQQDVKDRIEIDIRQPSSSMVPPVPAKIPVVSEWTTDSQQTCSPDKVQTETSREEQTPPMKLDSSGKEQDVVSAVKLEASDSVHQMPFPEQIETSVQERTFPIKSESSFEKQTVPDKSEKLDIEHNKETANSESPIGQRTASLTSKIPFEEQIFPEQIESSGSVKSETSGQEQTILIESKNTPVEKASSMKSNNDLVKRETVLSKYESSIEQQIISMVSESETLPCEKDSPTRYQSLFEEQANIKISETHFQEQTIPMEIETPVENAAHSEKSEKFAEEKTGLGKSELPKINEQEAISTTVFQTSAVNHEQLAFLKSEPSVKEPTVPAYNQSSMEQQITSLTPVEEEWTSPDTTIPSSPAKPLTLTTVDDSLPSHDQQTISAQKQTPNYIHDSKDEREAQGIKPDDQILLDINKQPEKIEPSTSLQDKTNDAKDEKESSEPSNQIHIRNVEMPITTNSNSDLEMKEEKKVLSDNLSTVDRIHSTVAVNTKLGPEDSGGTPAKTEAPVDYGNTSSARIVYEYDRAFLMELRFCPASQVKPKGLPALEIVLDQPFRYGTETYHHQLGTQKDKRIRVSEAKQCEPNSFASAVQRAKEIAAGIRPQETREEMVHTREDREKEQPDTMTLQERIVHIMDRLTPINLESTAAKMNRLAVTNYDELKLMVDAFFDRVVTTTETEQVGRYASLCKLLAVLKVPTPPDGTVKANMATFRVVLLTKCQEEFEVGKSVVFESLKVKRMKLEADYPEKTEDRDELIEKTQHEMTQRRQRFFGNIRFIGELFKLGMLTESIMHDCILHLLRAKNDHSLICVCNLLISTGQRLDTAKGKPRMDQYFSVLKRSADQASSPKIKQLLRSVIQLRENGWIPFKDVRKGEQPSTTNRSSLRVAQPGTSSGVVRDMTDEGTFTITEPFRMGATNSSFPSQPDDKGADIRKNFTRQVVERMKRQL